MDTEQRDLIGRLFVAALERIEGAHDLAVAGQAPGLAPSKLVDLARELMALTGDIDVLARAAIAVIHGHDDSEEA